MQIRHRNLEQSRDAATMDPVWRAVFNSGDSGAPPARGLRSRDVVLLRYGVLRVRII